MVLDTGPPSEAWRALAKIADESEEVAYDRTKRDFETLEIGVSESVAEYFARVHIILMKLERYKITTPAREIKRTVLSSLTSRFPNETRLYAMREDFELSDLEAGLARAEKFQSDQERRNASAHALAVAHTGSGQTEAGGGARGRGQQGRRSGKRHDNGRNQQHQQQRHPQHAPPAQQQHQPPAWQQQQPQQSPAWRQQQQQRHPQPQQRGPRHQQTPHGPWANWERPPPRQQFNPWTSWERPPPQQQYRSGGPHPRRPHHRGGDQPHWQQVLCQWCGEAEHFPAGCRATAPASVLQHRPYAASSFSGAYAVQYDTCLPPP